MRGFGVDRILYCYHPVGQGLFASGQLWRVNPEWQFVWVYDCGTTSSQKLIDRELDRVPFRYWTPSPPGRIDLVTISHFDKDHISGLARLLGRFPVDTLLLPLIPLWSRLMLAFEQNVGAGDSVFRLFLDPIGYIRSLDGGERVRRIVMVPPSRGEAPPEPPDEPPEDTERPAEIAEGGPELQIDVTPLDAETQADLMLSEDEATQVAMLAPGGRLRLESLWEFVPYNDGGTRPDDPHQFARQVASHAEELREVAAEWRAGRGTKAATNRAVLKLRDYYDDTFGKDAEARNVISLFLYTGPLFQIHKFTNPSPLPFSDLPWDRMGQLYSGDGYLNSTERLDGLVDHLGQKRLERIGAFQVMHHGAKGNWHPGVAERIAPNVSIFSSDPAHAGFGHPHAEVLRDFWTYGALQVGPSKSARLLIYIR